MKICTPLMWRALPFRGIGVASAPSAVVAVARRIFVMSPLMPLDADIVAASLEVLRMQGLVDVADEVEQEFHRFLRIIVRDNTRSLAYASVSI